MMRTPKSLTVILALLAVGSAAHADDDRLTLHVLNRLAFGPTAESVAAVHRLGVDGWIDEQLHPERIVEPVALTQRLSQLETLKLDPIELFRSYGPPLRAGLAPDPDARKAARQRAQIILRQGAEARLLRAVESPRQLEEIMVDFWFNHFNVFAQKGLDHLWVVNYELAAIRPHALGNFRSLLEATARHPAMLYYLDNIQNTAPDSPGAKGAASGLNENYARELMELHTLGVDGGYSQDDVIALARILTGWGVIRPQQVAAMPDSHGFAFDPSRHDFGDKIFLNHQIRGQGPMEVEQALDLLAQSPATARHLSYELAQYFVADTPPPALVDRLTRRWMQTSGDIRAVLADLFASPEFRNADDYGAKFKTPYQYVVSSVRAAAVPLANVRPLLNTLRRLGEPLYGCLTPDGYKNTRDAWLNSDALAFRLTFATGLGSGRLPLDRPPTEAEEEGAQPVSAAASPVPAPAATPLNGDSLMALLSPALSSQTRQAIGAAEPSLQAAMVLGSPEFMTR